MVRDRRRIDPETGKRRTTEESRGPAGELPAGTGPAETSDAAHWSPPSEGIPEIDELKAQLAERTADVQRVSAEYANYRKRVDRDRQLVVDTATANVLTSLLPVLDDLDRAREHGDLTGAFKSVADQLDGVLRNLGLEGFGKAGDPFDPTIHEAVMHATSTDVTEPTAQQVFRPGYRLGERLLRPAMVAVADPESPPAPAAEPEPATENQQATETQPPADETDSNDD